MKPVWTLEQARNFLHLLEPHVTRAGYGIALGGSVLMRGYSFKDLDVIVHDRAIPLVPLGMAPPLAFLHPPCRFDRMEARLTANRFAA
jgi:hypothetical protein